jgi:hypothetical protein
MPPIRSKSFQKSANQEGKILLALNDIKNSRIKSLRAAAKLYEIPHSTLHTRAYSIVSIAERQNPNQKLTQLEEDSLAKWIISIDTRGAAPRPSIVRDIANILLAARSKSPPATISKN